MPNAYLSLGEFQRWTTELGGRLDRQHGEVKRELSEIKSTVQQTNGKTNRNSEAIAVLQRDVAALIAEDVAIDQKVDTLQVEGCAHYQSHSAMLQELAGMSAWSGRRKAAIAGTLVGTGALMWPAIQKVAEAVSAVLAHVQ